MPEPTSFSPAVQKFLDDLLKKLEAEIPDAGQRELIFNSITSSLLGTYRDISSGRFYRNPTSEQLKTLVEEGAQLQAISPDQVMIELPEFNQVNNWVRTTTAKRQAASQYVPYVQNVPGQMPTLMWLTSEQADMQNAYDTLARAQDVASKEYQTAEKKVQDYYKRYGNLIDAQGNLTSVAAIEEKQKLDAILRQQPQLPYGPGTPWETSEEYQKFRREQSDLQAQADRDKRLQQGVKQATSYQLLPLDNAPINKVISEIPGRLEQQNLGKNIGAYAQANVGKATSEFDRLFPGARQAWQKALGRYDLPYGELGGMNLGEAAASLTNLYGARPADAFAIQKQVADQLKTMGADVAAADYAPGTVKDPMALFIENYPWYKDFIAQPASQRGYQPKRFAPTTRWM